MENHFYNSPEWMRLRANVFRRDGFRCVDCGSTENLQAHHLSTLDYRNPDISMLITLCNDCHMKRHEEQDRVNEAALKAAGELEDGFVYRMYLTDARKNVCMNGDYITCKFSRFISGKTECSTALFNDFQLRKFLATCGYPSDTIYGLSIEEGSADAAANEIRRCIGKPFDVRVRRDGEFWNVKCSEVFPVV